MSERADLLRIDGTGTVHPVGRTASQALRARKGDWRLYPGARDALLLRREPTEEGRLILAGEIRRGSLYDVIALIAQSSWTGELIVHGEDGERGVCFEGGNVISAFTNVPDERLGETLYRFGVVTREQLQTMLEAAAASGKRLGEAAIELEFVTPEELFPMMARQVEEVFFASLHVASGVFFFFDRFDEKRIMRRHNLGAAGLLMEAARRMDELRFFREKIPSDAYVPVPNPISGKRPPDDVASVFDQCDGKRDLAAIGRRIGQLEFEVTRAVFQLVTGGFVHVVPPRPEGPEAIVETFNPALAEIHRCCDEAGRGAELRDGLARFATGGGIFDPLFLGAGPATDGTLHPGRVARNLAVLAGDDPDRWLIQQLHEYTSFALFQAGSMLPRDVETELNSAVAERLKPIRQVESAVPTSRARP